MNPFVAGMLMNRLLCRDANKFGGIPGVDFPETFLCSPNENICEICVICG